MSKGTVLSASAMARKVQEAMGRWGVTEQSGAGWGAGTELPFQLSTP